MNGLGYPYFKRFGDLIFYNHFYFALAGSPVRIGCGGPEPLHLVQHRGFSLLLNARSHRRKHERAARTHAGE